jgi:hypothetical protein
MDEPGLLALVLDDELAPRVLAYWKAKRARLEDAESLTQEMARAVASTVEQTRATFNRCKLAGLVLDGDISTTASKWLATIVAQRLGLKPGRKPKAADAAG